MQPDTGSRHVSRLVFVLAMVVLPAALAADAYSQGTRKRALTHDDYDGFPSIRSTTYSRDGTWMAYEVRPSWGDGTLHIRQVDGDKSYEFERGQRVTFSDDGSFAIFKVRESVVEERRKKLEKLHEKKEESEESEEEEGLPPDIVKALEERGMTEAQALQMIEERGVTLAQVREFLGLPEPEKEGSGGKSGAKGEDDEDDEAEALEKRLHVLDLRTGEVTKIEWTKSFRHPEDSSLLVIHFDEPKKKKDEEKDGGAKEGAKEKAEEGKPEKKEPEKQAEKKEPEKAEKKAEEKKEPADPLEKRRKDGTRLVIRDLEKGTEIVIEHVRSYGLVADDEWLYYTIGTKKETEGVEHGLFAREFASGRTVRLLSGYGDVSDVTTDRDDRRVAFTSDVRSFAHEDKEKAKQRDIYVWDLSDEPARRVVSADTPGMPEDHRIRSRGLSFSRDASVLRFGVRPPKREELPKILPEDEVELDLWHWQDGLLQTMQAKRRDPAETTMTAVCHLDAGRVVVLGTVDAPSASLVTPDGSRALLADRSPYEKQMTWDGTYADYYLINTIDGSRRKIITGLRGSASASPIGKYVTWFDHRDYDWHALDVSTLEVRNLTEPIGVPFDRTKDDRPEPHNAHGRVGWTEDDAEVLLYDEFDIWAIDPATGDYRCVTDGMGRTDSIRFRNTSLDLRPDAQRDDDEDRTWLRDTLVLKAVDQNTYAEGYYTDSVVAVQKPRKLIMQDGSVSASSRPEDADRLFLTFSRFDQYPDVWTTDLSFSDPRKLTDVGQVLDQYRWGKAELVRWRSDDGVDLKGYLVKPDGFDPSRKYPMMVYFYERRSSRVHSFVTPSAGTSPNAAYYVSNGYLWFVPDIVYREGYPGESCEKCVVSGVQHVIDMGFVDEDAIGVAGHSWGGYQTAHLITRTDIFAAAESGAPVVNMFSAYGGIRWGSGRSRQFQYEKTQSRIGGSIWDYPMRYWENSPLFHLDRVNTPVLILHNDEDGAVPWYQGIEFFVAMRRLGKEAYMMNYNDEAHGLRKRQNKRDWTRRMQEFFDHHLKGAPAPAWMRQGVPYHERMAEKIPHAPSYHEAVEAGLLVSEAAEPAAAEASEAAATKGGSSGNR